MDDVWETYGNEEGYRLVVWMDAVSCEEFIMSQFPWVIIENGSYFLWKVYN